METKPNPHHRPSIHAEVGLKCYAPSYLGSGQDPDSGAGAAGCQLNIYMMVKSFASEIGESDHPASGQPGFVIRIFIAPCWPIRKPFSKKGSLSQTSQFRNIFRVKGFHTI